MSLSRTAISFNVVSRCWREDSSDEESSEMSSFLLSFNCRSAASPSLGDHLKAAIYYHFKTGHREAA
jgi:hypothetical protein